jgi:hypothetical protein
MIAGPTVLVLGAGASMPYGYPSGAALRQRLIDESLFGRVVQNGLLSPKNVVSCAGKFVAEFTLKYLTHCPGRYKRKSARRSQKSVWVKYYKNANRVRYVRTRLCRSKRGHSMQCASTVR